MYNIKDEYVQELLPKYQGLQPYRHREHIACREEVDLAVCYYIVMTVNGKALSIIKDEIKIF